MIINLYFDHKYFHWANPIVRSIKVHEPSTKIYFHTYNLSEDQVEELESYSNTAYVDNMKLKFDPKISDAYYKHLNETDPLRFQLTCRKGEYILKAMSKFPEEDLFIVMDVDMLLRCPLNDLRKQMKDCDIGIVKRSETKIAGGFCAASSTKGAKHFLTMFDKLVMKDRLYLCKDQKTLSRVYNETNTKIKFLLLDGRYLDHSSSEKSYIWSAHKSSFGTKQERYEKYLKVVKQMEGKRNAR